MVDRAIVGTSYLHYLEAVHQHAARLYQTGPAWVDLGDGMVALPAPPLRDLLALLSEGMSGKEDPPGSRWLSTPE